MSIQNRNAANVVPAPTLPIISDTLEESIVSVLSDMHSLVATYGEPLPAFEQCDLSQYLRILGRVKAALEAKAADRKEQALRSFRSAIRTVIAPLVDNAKSEYDSYLEMVEGATPTAKRYIQPFNTYISVPVAQMSEAFPPLTPLEVQVRKLNDMGYVVTKGADKSFNVRVELPFMKPAVRA